MKALPKAVVVITTVMFGPGLMLKAQKAVNPAREVRNWNPQYGRITGADLKSLGSAAAQLDLHYFRLNPSALDQKAVMQYFIALNNCANREVGRALSNELDYPALAEMYKANASQILASVPQTITDFAFERYIGGSTANGWALWTRSLSMGEYDRQRKTFPLKRPDGADVQVPPLLAVEGARRLEQTCPVAANFVRSAQHYLPGEYSVALPPATYRELPLDEASARQYIDGADSQRAVFLALDVAILDTPPKVDRTGESIHQATLRARVARLRVVDSRTESPVGTLFDDGTVRKEPQTVQSPPPVSPSGVAPSKKENWDAVDHMFDIRMSVYVSLVADACQRALSDAQSANLKRFLDRVSNGGFNEKMQYNAARATVLTKIIGPKGRIEYCADPVSRKDFDRYAAMVAPLGPLAASGAK